MNEFFIMGWDGWGNPYGIHTQTGEVVFEDHNFGGVHVMAASFEEFLLKWQVEAAGASRRTRG